MTSVVTGPNPVGGVIQPGSWNEAGTHWLSVGKDTGARTSGECQGQSHRWTYRQHCGNVRLRVTGGRTGGRAALVMVSRTELYRFTVQVNHYFQVG